MYSNLVFVGRLSKDPEMRFTPGGQPVTNLSVAVDRHYTGQDGAPVKETTWFRVSVWGKQAETCNQYLSKGKLVLIEGRLIANEQGGPRVYERADHTFGASFEVNASIVKFLSPKAGGSTEAQPEAEASEEVPF